MKFLLTAALAFTATGCSSDASSGEITVKDNDDVSYNKVMMQNLEKHKGIAAIEWLNNDQVFIGQKTGFGRYDLKSHQVETIYKKKDKYWNISPSPDKKHAFIATSNHDDGTNNFYYMMDLKTKKQVSVSFAFQKFDDVSSSSWFDNENLVLTNYTGEIFEVHVSGKVTKINHAIKDLEDVEEKYSIDKVNDQFYYMDQENLFVWNKKTNQTKMLMKDVENFVASPDKTKIAVEKIIPISPNETYQGKDNTKTKEDLIIIDLAGNTQSTVTEGPDIGGMGWSPDSKKLAYSITRSHSNELYVSDIFKPQPKLLAVNILGFFADYDPIKWSPEGNKLLINGYTDPNQDPNYSPPVLHIITLNI